MGQLALRAPTSPRTACVPLYPADKVTALVFEVHQCWLEAPLHVYIVLSPRGGLLALVSIPEVRVSAGDLDPSHIITDLGPKQGPRFPGQRMGRFGTLGLVPLRTCLSRWP